MSITIKTRSGDSTGVDIADPPAAPAPCRRPCGDDVRAVMLPLTVVCSPGGDCLACFAEDSCGAAADDVPHSWVIYPEDAAEFRQRMGLGVGG